MADNTQQMGFDFSKDFQDFEKIIKYFEKYNLKLAEITQASIQYNKATQDQSAVIKGITVEGQKAIITIDNLRDAQGRLRAYTDATTVTLSSQIEQIKKFQATVGNLSNTNFNFGFKNLNTTSFSGLNATSGIADQNAEQVEDARKAQADLLNLYVTGAKNREEIDKENAQTETIIFQQHYEDVVASQRTFQNELTQLLMSGQASRRRATLEDQANYKRQIEEFAQVQADAEYRNSRNAALLAQEARASDQRKIINSAVSQQFGPIAGNASVDQKLNFAQNISEVTNHIAEGRVSLQRFNELLTGVRNNTVVTFNETEQRVVRSIFGAEKAYNDLGTAIGTRNREILLSWQSMARVFEVQILHNVFGGLIQQLHTGTQEAIALSIKIGEIQTISQENPLHPEKWLDGIRQLSDAYGRDLKDVAQGVYETLSNQVAKGAEAITFLNSALKFAVVTNSTTEESVNVLTAAINAFGLKVSDTDKIAAGFFKTIELGRVKASEMSESLGRILPTAHRLGISLDEIEAAIATLTISGLKYDEAFTLISNTMLKLIKPTKDFQQTIESWGVTSGEAAVEGYGFVGLLKKLEEASGGSDEEFAKMFNNLRAIRGALGLTGSAFETYTTNLDKIKGAQESYNNAAKLALGSEGQRLSEEFQKIKNVFIVDFGTQIVHNLVSINEFIKGIGGLSGAIKDLGSAALILSEGYILTRLVNSFIAISKGTNVATLGFNTLRAAINLNGKAAAEWASLTGSALGAAIGPGGWIAIGLTAAAYGWNLYNQEIQRQINLEKTLDAQFEITKQNFIKSRTDILDKTSEAMSQSTNRLFSVLVQQSSIVGREISNVLSIQKDALKENDELLKASLEAALKTQEQSLTDLRSQQRTLEDEIKRSQQNQGDLNDRFGKTSFEFNLSRAENDPVAQVNLLIERLKELEKQGDAAFGNHDRDLGTKRYEEAYAILTKLTELESKYTKESSVKVRDNSAQEHIQQTIAQLQQQRSRSGQNASIDAQIATLEKSLKEIRANAAIDKTQDTLANAQKAKEAVQDIQKSLGTNAEDAIGKLTAGIKQQEIDYQTWAKTELVRLEQDEKAKIARVELYRKNISEIVDFNLFDKSGNLKYKSVEDAQKDFDKFLANAEKNGLTKGTDEWKKVWDYRIEIAKEAQTEIYADQQKKQQDQFIKDKAALETTLQRAKDVQAATISDVGEKQKQLLVKSGLLENTISPFLLNEKYPKAPEYNSLLNQLHDVTSERPETDRDKESKANRLAALSKQLRELETFANNNHLQSISFTLNELFDLKFLNKSGQQTPLRQILQDIEKASNDLTKSKEANSKSAETYSKITDELIKLEYNFAGLPAASEKATNKIQSDFETIKKSIDDAFQSAEKLKKEFENMNPGAIIPGGPTIIHGDPNFQVTPITPSNSNYTQYHASGGEARGLDSISTMLSPGEFVINSAATQAFLPQLIAMNAKQNTQNRGGNTSIGDVHVHGIPITGNITVDARTMGRALKKEIRRGSISLNSQE